MIMNDGDAPRILTVPRSFRLHGHFDEASSPTVMALNSKKGTVLRRLRDRPHKSPIDRHTLAASSLYLASISRPLSRIHRCLAVPTRSRRKFRSHKKGSFSRHSPINNSITTSCPCRTRVQNNIPGDQPEETVLSWGLGY